MNKVELKVEQTGGGCEAYVAVLSNGYQLVITEHDDPSLPDVRSRSVDVGIYKDNLWSEENQVALETVKIERPGSRKEQADIKYVCEAIAFKVANKHLGHLFKVPCGLCGTPTPMTATERCDGCWELETRIKSQPALARQILSSIKED